MPRAGVIRVLIAPDKFKGTLTAPEATRAIETGVRAAAAARGVALDIDPCPIADGGEGTAEIIASSWPGAQRHTTEVTGPLDGPARVHWWLDGDAHAAFDSASACGLVLVPEHRRDPARCTTRGVGTMLHLALTRARTVAVGLGGSATVDGGVGLAAEMGWRFEGVDGRPIASPRGIDLSRIARAIPPPESSPLRAVLRGRRVQVLCDVVTPLLGEHGCAPVFGPQKGATPAAARDLDEGLRNLAGVVGVVPVERDGAAGGLAFGLRVFVGPLVESLTLESGAEVVLRAVRLSDRVQRADLVITGEGRYDRTSRAGKAVGEVLAAARRAGRPALIVAGSRGEGVAEAGGVTIATCEPTGAPPDPRSAADALRAAAAAAFARWLGGPRGDRAASPETPLKPAP